MNPVDFLNLESQYTNDELQWRDRTREFINNRVMPEINEYFELGEFPRHLIRPMGELGLFGANLTGYGCPGASETAYGLIMKEIERADSGLRSFASIQSSLVMYPIYTFGSEAQKDRWLPKLARGEAIGCFGLTEPNHGSDPGGMETTARRNGEEYVLNGSKRWIGNATVADVAVVWAKNEAGEVEGYLVEKDAPGLQTNEIPGKFSLRTIISGELHFDNCRIPVANKLPGAQGLKAALMCLTKARYGIAWGVIGAAEACYQEAVHYTTNRQQFDVPLASFQLVQDRLVHMLTEITKMQAITLPIARLMERGEAKHYHVSMIKRNNVYHALEIARLARDVLGGNGILYKHHIGRHLCNLESVITYEGTHSIHTLILGQHITGIPAFR